MIDNGIYTRNFANSLQLSGLVAQKLKIKTIKANGVDMKIGSFVLIQNYIGHNNYRYKKHIICCTRSQKVIDELLSYDKQIYITCLGKLDGYWNEKVGMTTYYPLIEEINVESICPEDMRK